MGDSKAVYEISALAELAQHGVVLRGIWARRRSDSAQQISTFHDAAVAYGLRWQMQEWRSGLRA
jgi:hypothetical protein